MLHHGTCPTAAIDCLRLLHETMTVRISSIAESEEPFTTQVLRNLQYVLQDRALGTSDGGSVIIHIQRCIDASHEVFPTFVNADCIVRLLNLHLDVSRVLPAAMFVTRYNGYISDK